MAIKQSKQTLLSSATGTDSRLTAGQNTFAQVLASQTGLDINVIAAWMLAEESGGAAQSRQAQGNHDWLNIGYTDSAQLGTGNSVWHQPVSAAQETAGWLAGTTSVPGFGYASQGIRAILKTAGKPAAEQIAAIAGSGWASSGYNGGSTLRQLYNGSLKQPAPGAGPVAAAAGAAAGFAVGGLPGAAVGGVLGETGLLGGVAQGLLGLTGDVVAQLALVAVGVAKDATIGFVDIVIAPWWHWNQRAVEYYYKSELFDTTSKKHWTVLPWSAVFWGFGYWLLWTDPDSGNLKPQPVRKSRLARHVRTAQAIPARRSIVKPKNVKERTAKKPTPVVSRATITQTGTMKATRHERVQISGIRSDGQSTGTNQPTDSSTDGTGTPTGPPTAAGREGETNTTKNAVSPAKPDTSHRAGSATLQSRRGDTAHSSGTSAGKRNRS